MSEIIKHWYVIIDPDQYDDEDDVGHAWSGPAKNRADAIAQACVDCAIQNTEFDSPNDADEARSGPDGYWFIDPETVSVIDAHPDQRRHARELLKASRELRASMSGPDLRQPTGADYLTLANLVEGWLSEPTETI
ncbi:MAG: hypothetical protein ACOVKC_10200 [Brevundimonas sp.]